MTISKQSISNKLEQEQLRIITLKYQNILTLYRSWPTDEVFETLPKYL